jgi:purine nucleosidase
MNHVRKVIIDTDCGVDDAFALLLLLEAHKKTRQGDYSLGAVEVVGITCVSGNIHLGSVIRNVSYVLELTKTEEIPFYAGAAKPLLGEFATPNWEGHGTDGLGGTNLGHENLKPKPLHAAQALIELTKQHPDTYLITIGPFTNVALAVCLDPTLPKRVIELISMAGAYQALGNSSFTSEWNVFADPEAARICFEQFPKVQMISWELAVSCGIDWEWFDKFIKYNTTNNAKFMTAIMAKYESLVRNKLREVFISADVVAVAAFLKPELIKSRESVYGTIELAGQFSRGQTVFDWGNLSGKDPNVEIVKALDHASYKKMLEAVLMMQ